MLPASTESVVGRGEHSCTALHGLEVNSHKIFLKRSLVNTDNLTHDFNSLLFSLAFCWQIEKKTSETRNTTSAVDK